MCGRFTNRLTWREIVALYRLSVPATPERNLPARYNICPTDTIDAVIEREGKRELMPMRWGLVPSWWKKKAKEAPATFNARAESVAEKPMFRDAFYTRCLNAAPSVRKLTIFNVIFSTGRSARSVRAMAPYSPQDNDLSTHAHACIQVHNVLVVHANASVRDEAADRPWIVGAVDSVLTSAAQGQCRRAHRI